MSRAQEITRAGTIRWIHSTRHSIAAAVVLGLSITSATYGQQPPVWSPQPYVKPSSNTDATLSASESHNQVPHNKLRSSTTTEPATTLRWSKVEGSSSSSASNYSQAMKADRAFNDNGISDTAELPRISRTKVARHNSLASRSDDNISPSTGWAVTSQGTEASNGVVAASAQQPVSNSRPKDLVQLASQESVPGAPERMKAWPGQQTRGNAIKLEPATGSTRREWRQIQSASFQEESSKLDLPMPPAGLPGVGAPGLNSEPNASEQSPPSLVLPPTDLQRRSEPSPSDLSQPNAGAFDSAPQMSPPSSRSPRVSIDCESLRKSIEASDIRSIAVDSSPKFVEGYKGSRVTSSKDEFVRTAPMRDWYGNDGEKIAFGKLVDYTRGQVFIETPEGERVSYLFNRLSSVDLAYVSDAWGLPVVCALSDGTLEPRQFVETTMTFKASGSCHKPLYFEEPQLERYGHEWGPVVQPVISTANFVKNVAILPYKMGIHSINECQYPLGY